ncbi:MAG: hypothetical protein DRQ02_02190 [Candidatus Latescibacterota bacterium]|nr:MAG: hypothetical protein DRQ02_02190 [Candidatus Latescibacterota bacterium]RKY73697.1 MAG: hypothetical protein DRQ24_01785 [Candidatus Latescibacterota bacterium]HDN67439.1 hypothetical protein [Bacillota bacterium]
MKTPDKSSQRFRRLKAEIGENLADLKALVQELEGIKDSLVRDSVSTYDLRAVGSILHDFYNGVEDLFCRIAQELNGGLPAGKDWHRQLLVDMAVEIEGVRPPVISKLLKRELQRYLGFRHVFRHIYGFSLEKERIRELCDSLPSVLDSLERDLLKFCQYLDILSQEV